MKFSTYFRLASYATIAAATLTLFIAGGTGAGLALAFAVVLIAAWKLEGTRWQLSERAALIVILVSLPLFYVDWRILTPYLQIEFLERGSVWRGGAEVTVLAHLILFLSAVKLLQRKGDRDWFFLYLISFFEVLLAAGLSASPTFLATLALYLLCALTTVVAFEIQKARRKVTATQTRLLVSPDSTLFRKLPMRLWRRRYLETRPSAVSLTGIAFPDCSSRPAVLLDRSAHCLKRAQTQWRRSLGSHWLFRQRDPRRDRTIEAQRRDCHARQGRGRQRRINCGLALERGGAGSIHRTWLDKIDRRQAL